MKAIFLMALGVALGQAQETPTERDAARDVLQKMAALEKSIDAPGWVAKFSAANAARDQVTARDLVFEKVDSEKVVSANDKLASSGDVKIETAAYVVSRNTAADARLVVDLKLKHE